jgi:hypothetical protein
MRVGRLPANALMPFPGRMASRIYREMAVKSIEQKGRPTGAARFIN